MANRVYTDTESACVNTDFSPGGSRVDFLPAAYSIQTADHVRYETDTIAPMNWPGPLGVDGENWYVLWDHMANPGTPDCIGFYGAQADVLQFGEFGHHRKSPCEKSTSTAPISCADPLRGVIAASCNPQPETSIGVIDRVGGLGPVPIPVISSVGAKSLADPSFSLQLTWLPACVAVPHDGSPQPVMGFRVELFFDVNGNGTGDPPTRCDEASELFLPVLDIAPVPDPNDGIPDLGGGASSTTVSLTAADLMVPGSPPAAIIEGLTFRIRILFQDDRHSPKGIGGLDGIIDPILSLPSLHSDTLAVAGKCHDADNDGFGRNGIPACPAGGEIDCDDADPAAHPGGTEICGDGIDNDCNSSSPDLFDADLDKADCSIDCDETDPGMNLDDADQDSYSTCDGDCDDADPSIHPGAGEIPANTVDEDCDGFAEDADGDGFSENDGDCDDDDPDTHPGAEETGGNEVDEDCDGAAEDRDGDGYLLDDGDCVDDDPEIHPGALETPDQVDNDCDGRVDEPEVRTTCQIIPATMNLQSNQSGFSIETSLRDPRTDELLDVSLLEPVHIFRIESPGLGNLGLSPPDSGPDCSDATDNGIWENQDDRSITRSGSAKLRFNLPSDGQCNTRDGNRDDLVALMVDLTDGETVQVCFQGAYPDFPDPVECCGSLMVTNRGNR